MEVTVLLGFLIYTMFIMIVVVGSALGRGERGTVVDLLVGLVAFFIIWGVLMGVK